MPARLAGGPAYSTVSKSEPTYLGVGGGEGLRKNAADGAGLEPSPVRLGSPVRGERRGAHDERRPWTGGCHAVLGRRGGGVMSRRGQDAECLSGEGGCSQRGEGAFCRVPYHPTERRVARTATGRRANRHLPADSRATQPPRARAPRSGAACSCPAVERPTRARRSAPGGADGACAAGLACRPRAAAAASGWRRRRPPGCGLRRAGRKGRG
eukprot:scaffold6308_cov111-Isochrysis_galbana.AAC.4